MSEQSDKAFEQWVGNTTLMGWTGIKHEQDRALRKSGWVTALEWRDSLCCVWTGDDDEYYETGCGGTFAYEGGRPAGSNYCPNCGKRVEVAKEKPEIDQGKGAG